jgi:hypothetical protein
MNIAISEDAVPIVRDSINREIILLESKISLLNSEIKLFEEKYNMTSSEFQKKFDRGDIGDSQDFFEWWGLKKGLSIVEDRLNKAKAVIVHW